MIEWSLDKRKRADDSFESPTRLSLKSPTVGGENGAAARLAKVERATALALIDLGQRNMMVPLPKRRPGKGARYFSSRNEL